MMQIYGIHDTGGKMNVHVSHSDIIPNRMFKFQGRSKFAVRSDRSTFKKLGHSLLKLTIMNGQNPLSGA